MPGRSRQLSDRDFQQLANFRYALRRFLEFSENAAAAEGLTAQQHQALLAIRAYQPEPATVGWLASRLRIRHNTAVELAQRLEAAGLITREPSPEDRRAVQLLPTADGLARLEKLTQAHRAELRQLSPEILQALQGLEAEEG